MILMNLGRGYRVKHRAPVPPLQGTPKIVSTPCTSSASTIKLSARARVRELCGMFAQNSCIKQKEGTQPKARVKLPGFIRLRSLAWRTQ